MMRIIYVLVAILLCFAQRSEAYKLLQSSDFTYLGAFRVPKGALGGDDVRYQTMALGGDGLSITNRNSLIIYSRAGDAESNVVEISIPTIVNDSSIENLNTATLLQVPGKLDRGMRHKLDIDGEGNPTFMNETSTDSGGRLHGLLVFNGRIYGSSYSYYTDEYHGYLSHFSADLDWVASGIPYGFSGFKQLGPGFLGVGTANSGFIAKFMCKVPANRVADIGFPALTGSGALAVNQRTSSGPAIAGFNPANIDTYTTTQEIPYQMFVAYPQTHLTLGDYTYGNLYYGMGTQIFGMAWPDGSDTVIISQRSGRGYGGDGDWEGCYGTGTADIALHGTVKTVGEIWCYDPANVGIHGGHSYPYFSQFLLYDANDFLEVKAGTKQYYEVLPYARVELDLPYSSVNPLMDLGGITYDESTGRLYVVQKSTDTIQGGDGFPIVHVFHINLGKRYRMKLAVEE